MPKSFLLFMVAIVVSAGLFTAAGHATEKYAEATGQTCAICHLDPLGGGELTETGYGYLLSIDPDPVPRTTSPWHAQRIIKLVVGYLHIVTAFLWFGTILYVHLVLKPAYASQGLPRSEMKVGLASMAIMAITGSVLTYYKIPSFDLLLSSTFGILLLAKITIFTIMASSAVFVVLVIGPRLKQKKNLPKHHSGDLSRSELASFDGQEGRPAYIAFQGTIYDVSQSKRWRGGSHMKRHQAGGDLTDILSQAPHGEETLKSMPVVGQLAMKQRVSPHEIHTRIFFFMAYMNLSFVFVISLILALWRWY